MKTFKKSIVTGLVATILMVVAAAGLAMAEDSITGTITDRKSVV